MNSVSLTRRHFLAAGVAVAASTKLYGVEQQSGREICAFIKGIQSFSFGELGERIADAGFTGVEATIRKNGVISPEDAPAKLPELHRALAKHGVSITTMASDMNDPQDVTQRAMLETAADLGIKHYRMKYFTYDVKQPIQPQLDALRPRVRSLADLNRKLGVTGLYQNHSGAKYVGAGVWDLVSLLEDVDPSEVGVAFDVRHAAVEGGLSWPVLYRLARPHVGMLYVKDYQWDGARPNNVPLGQGRTPRELVTMAARENPLTPISLHVEYHLDDPERNMAALRADLATLNEWIG